MKVFTDTNYREHGAGDLLNYIDKEQGLENRFGEEMSEAEKEAFIEQSEEYDFERQVIISPEHGDDLSNEEFSRYARRVMSDFCQDRPTATYCYAIHRDTEHPHVQVALTGTKRDLWMDKQDCWKLRDRAHEVFHDQRRELTHELSHDLEHQWQSEHEEGHQHVREQRQRLQQRSEADQAFDRSREDGQEHENSGDGDRDRGRGVELEPAPSPARERGP